MKKIILIAGDRSGDLYGGMLCKQLSKIYPEVKLYSCGGDNLAKNSQQLIDLLSHSVSGLVEVLSSLAKIKEIFDKTYAEIDKLKPDLIIPIDFPDFNFRLIKKLDKRYPVFYYISPQVWAWRKKRINFIRDYVDKIIVIFKFEQDFYREEGIDASYFGHPLLEVVPDLDIKAKNIISFLPGSRRNEVKKHLPIMLKTKSILKAKLPDYSFRIIRPKNLDQSIYEKLPTDIEIIPHSYQALKESNFIIASSGTATVEIAILGVPYLIMYKLNTFSWTILKLLVKTEFIGMVNILQGKAVVKELVQNQANPQNMARITLDYLNNPESYQNLKKELESVKDILNPYGASRKFAEFIGKFLNL